MGQRRGRRAVTGIATGIATGAVMLAVQVASAGAAQAEPGVHADRIVFGQAAALDGPAAALGQGMRAGLLAAFAEANAGGGVRGRRLELVSRDDGYEPGRSAEETRRLINRDGVFALVGAVGDAAAEAALPVAGAAGVPFVGALGGGTALRDPARRGVVTLRPALREETAALVAHLTEERRAGRVAVLYQDDALGRAGLAGVEAAMEARGLPLVARGAFARNTTAVKAAFLAVRKAKADAVVMIGAYEPCAAFVALARRLDPVPAFAAVSAVGPAALADALGPAAAGIAVSRVVPAPDGDAPPLLAAHRAAMAALPGGGPVDAVSLEGYAVGRMVVQALARVPGDPSRVALVEALGSLTDLGGVPLRFGPDDVQGWDGVTVEVLGTDGGAASPEGAAAPKG